MQVDNCKTLDEFIEVYMTIGNNTVSNVCRYIIANQTDELLKILKSVLNVPSKYDLTIIAEIQKLQHDTNDINYIKNNMLASLCVPAELLGYNPVIKDKPEIVPINVPSIYDQILEIYKTRK